MSEEQISTSRLGQYAGFVTRLIAWVIDNLIIFIVNTLVSVTALFVLASFGIEGGPTATFVHILVLIFGVLFYFWYFIGSWMATGLTVGKSIMGLRVVRTDGERIKFRNAIVRLFGYWISAFFFFLGYLWILVDRRRMAWHDHLARTIVVYSENWEERQEQKTRLRDYSRHHQQLQAARQAEDAT